MDGRWGAILDFKVNGTEMPWKTFDKIAHCTFDFPEHRNNLQIHVFIICGMWAVGQDFLWLSLYVVHQNKEALLSRWI